MDGQGIKHRIRACDYLTVAQLFLQDNFFLERPLAAEDIKARLLGHWGTCHGINVAYANLRAYYEKDLDNFQFILGPGHGFPALQANLFLDGDLEKVDKKATLDAAGIEYICKYFSWPDGFPSHASPITPGIIIEGGELGYALAAAYGAGLNQPEKTIAVLIGDGEFETATTLASLNLNKIISAECNAKILPILHLNGYKISAPTVAARKSERELNQLLRGFGYQPIIIKSDDPADFQAALKKATASFQNKKSPFLILKTKKGATGPGYVNGKKITGNYLSHQIPLPNAKTDPAELKILADWLASYRFSELFNKEKGFTL